MLFDWAINVHSSQLCPLPVGSVCKGKLITHKGDAPARESPSASPPQPGQLRGPRVFPEPDRLLPRGQRLCSEQPSAGWRLTAPPAARGGSTVGTDGRSVSQEGRGELAAGEELCFSGS